MRDAVILSDIHLGSDNCQAKALTRFLEAIHAGDIATHRLILNGDVFDSIDFRRLKKNHWKVLSILRKLSDRIDVLWLNGNHDGPSEIVSHLLGVRVQDEFVLQTGDRKALILHGHIFDEFIDNHPVLTYVADSVYHLLQKLDRSHYFARLVKRKSKIFLRSTQKIQTKSIDYARKQNCQIVCCGHTHLATAYEQGDVWYYNSGCWTEKPCHYLAIEAGKVTVHEYNPIPVTLFDEDDIDNESDRDPVDRPIANLTEPVR